MSIYELCKKVHTLLDEIADAKSYNDIELAHIRYDQATDLIITYITKVVGTQYNNALTALCMKLKAAEPAEKWYA